MLQRLNKTLASLSGYELRRAGRPSAPSIKKRGGKASKPGASQVAYRPPQDPDTDRLLRRPVFIISPVRSGSTLLRLLLNAHSRLHAPHELHVRRLEVGIGSRLGGKSMTKLGLEIGDLEHLLWDRVMHRELVKAGKDVIVEKTPSNAFAYKRLATAWPDARFIFLLRHPASIAKSWHEADTNKRTESEAALDSLRYMRAVERAKSALTGYTVKYEDLTDDPETALRGICRFLDIDFEPGMLEYGKAGGGDFTKGLGDWKEKIRSGTVMPGRTLPSQAEIPEPLREISAQWGYLDTPTIPAQSTGPAEPHAEVAQIWPKDGAIRVTGTIVGEPAGGLDRQWRLELVLNGHEQHTREVSAAVDGRGFDASVRVDDVNPPHGLGESWWDVHLVADGSTRLRVGRHLDGIADKTRIMVFPEQTTAEGVTLRPAYAPDNNLSVEFDTTRRPVEPSEEDEPTTAETEVPSSR